MRASASGTASEATVVGPLPYSALLGAHPVDEPAAWASAEAKWAYAAAGFEAEK